MVNSFHLVAFAHASFAVILLKLSAVFGQETVQIKLKPNVPQRNKKSPRQQFVSASLMLLSPLSQQSPLHLHKASLNSTNHCFPDPNWTFETINQDLPD